MKTYIDYKTPLSNYNRNYSVEYYEPTKKPNNGIDFDQSQAGISILSSNFQLVFGKFKTNIGPFYKSNLSISENAPNFEQLMLKVNYKKKIYFSYLWSYSHAIWGPINCRFSRRGGFTTRYF